MKMSEVSDNLMYTIAHYMDDDIREELHRDLAPCTHEEFLRAYIDRCPDFEDILEHEFSVEV